MGADVSEKRKRRLLARAIRFMSNCELFGYYMNRVVKEWRYSCEHNLTDLNQNRIAWLGQAACAMAIGCPCDITKHAWGFLKQIEQEDADKKAAFYIQIWERNYEEQNTARSHQLAIKGIL